MKQKYWGLPEISHADFGHGLHKISQHWHILAFVRFCKEFSRLILCEFSIFGFKISKNPLTLLVMSYIYQFLAKLRKKGRNPYKAKTKPLGLKLALKLFFYKGNKLIVAEILYLHLIINISKSNDISLTYILEKGLFCPFAILWPSSTKGSNHLNLAV